jgi:hypothetical protein
MFSINHPEQSINTFTRPRRVHYRRTAFVRKQCAQKWRRKFGTVRDGTVPGTGELPAIPMQALCARRVGDLRFRPNLVTYVVETVFEIPLPHPPNKRAVPSIVDVRRNDFTRAAIPRPSRINTNRSFITAPIYTIYVARRRCPCFIETGDPRRRRPDRECNNWYFFIIFMNSFFTDYNK